MTEHLSNKEIKRLENKELKGKAYTRALLHLNSCAECRSRLIVPSAEEIMRSIFGEDEEASDDKPNQEQPEETRKNKPESWQEKLKNWFRLDFHQFVLVPQTA